MDVTKETIEYLAGLSRLKLQEEEKDHLVDNLQRILTFVDQLNDVPTTDIEPLIFLNQRPNAGRFDQVVPDITREDGLKNGPDVNDKYFLVPKVIG